MKFNKKYSDKIFHIGQGLEVKVTPAISIAHFITLKKALPDFEDNSTDGIEITAKPEPAKAEPAKVEPAKAESTPPKAESTEKAVKP